MDQYLSFVTLAVDDLDAARAFYLDGLGWVARQDGEEVIFIQLGPALILSLWQADAFRAEVGEPGTGLPPITLAHNVESAAAVDAVLERARAAGASVVRPGEHRAWGGYTGYFADPAGFMWEIAHNPFDVDVAAAGIAWSQQQRAIHDDSSGTAAQ